MTLKLYGQPRAAVTVDMSNPLAYGLIGCWVVTGDSLLPRNIAGGVTDSPNILNGGAGIAAVVASEGFALQQNGSSLGGIGSSLIENITEGEITVLVAAAFATSNPVSNSPLAISIGSVQGVDTSFNVGIWDNQYLWCDMGNDYTYRPIPGGFSPNTPVMIGAVLNGDLSRAFYFNGIRVGGEAAAKGPYAGNAGVALMQQRSIQTANTAMNGLFYLGYVWNRALISTEFALLAATPFAFLQPATGTLSRLAAISTNGGRTGPFRLSIGVGM